MARQTKAVTAVPAWRFRIAVATLSALTAMLVWRALSLQVLDTGRGYQFLQGQGNARTIRTEVIPAHRGMIADRNGQPLAVSTPVASIWANPQELAVAREQWPELARALGIELKQLSRKIEQYRNHQFMYLRRQLPPTEAAKILALKVSGVYVQREYQRFYPAGEVAAHVVGFTDIDDRGQEGLELAYNDWLQGVPGSKRVLKDLYGNVIRDLNDGKPAHPGKDLYLSIDLRLQYLAYRELKAALARSNAQAGSVVMLDSDTGEVLAMVNQPSYNPNNRSQLQVSALRNRAVIDMFEPGSTVKPLTVVAALESGKFTPTTTIDTSPGYIRVGRKTLMDPVNYGAIDVTRIITKSSQVGISKMALALNEQSVFDVFQRFGFGVPTGTGFPGENTGVLPMHVKWHPIERVNFAFGYGLTTTALQLARAYSVFASGGVLHPVHLLRVDQPAQQQSRRVIDEAVARDVVAMLETVTNRGGTGTRAQVDAYRVAGKTGTVHKLGPNGYAHDRYMALFAGIAPASEPRVVTIVTIDQPGNDHYYGGEAAAPVFSRVTADAMRLLNIAPDNAPDGNAVPQTADTVTPAEKMATSKPSNDADSA